MQAVDYLAHQCDRARGSSTGARVHGGKVECVQFWVIHQVDEVSWSSINGCTAEKQGSEFEKLMKFQKNPEFLEKPSIFHLHWIVIDTRELSENSFLFENFVKTLPGHLENFQILMEFRV